MSDVLPHAFYWACVDAGMFLRALFPYDRKEEATEFAKQHGYDLVIGAVQGSVSYDLTVTY